MIHELKTIQPYYDQVIFGKKTFEFRKDDRNFNVGDYLILKEFDPIIKQYSGASCGVTITSILRGFTGIQDGYCVLSINRPIIYTHAAI